MIETTESVPDNYLYHAVSFRADTLKFYIDAFSHYLALLETDLQSLQDDPFISKLLGEDVIENVPIAREISRIKQYIEFLERMIRDAGNRWVEWSLYQSEVRLIKSIVGLYLSELKIRRDTFARSHRVSIAALESIDNRMAKLSENILGGVFEKADPVLLLTNAYEDSISSSTQSKAQRDGTPLPTPIYGIELLDVELRERCLDLVGKFANDPSRLDTIISEATRLLEHRIRNLSGADSTLSGLELIASAFAGNNPRLQLSDNPAEREAAHLLFRGVFGFIRNPFHHRIIPINKDRAIQLLGLVDYILFLVDSSGRVPPNP